MTSRDWQADRRAVFDRDDHTCRHCGATDAAADPTALRTYPVGAVPLEGTVHEHSLATVCADCFETLGGASDAASATVPPASRADLFDLVRETTRGQGSAISDVAAFASLATSLPSTLAEGEADAGADSGSDADSDAASADDSATVAETAADYRQHRRDVALAVDIADAHLERLAEVDETAFDPPLQSSLETVTGTATRLQSTLRRVVELSETVPAGLEYCHGCFAALEDGSCSTCGLEPRATADWQRDDSGLAFERLFETINDELQSASSTTETLTGQTTTLAEQLTADD